MRRFKIILIVFLVILLLLSFHLLTVEGLDIIISFIMMVVAVIGLIVTISEYLTRKHSAINEYEIYFFKDSKITLEYIENNRFNSIDLPYTKLLHDLEGIIKYSNNKNIQDILKDDIDKLIEKTKTKNYDKTDLYKTIRSIETSEIKLISQVDNNSNLNFYPKLINSTNEYSYYMFYHENRFYSLKFYKSSNKTTIRLKEKDFIFFDVRKIKGIGKISGIVISITIITPKGEEIVKNYNIENIEKSDKLLFDIDDSVYSEKNHYEVLEFKMKFINQYGELLEYKLNEAITKGHDILHYGLERVDKL